MERRKVRWIVVGAGLVAIAAIVAASFERRVDLPCCYEEQSSSQHATELLALAVIAAVLETALLYGVFARARRGRLWRRALGGLTLMVPWCACATMSLFVTHAPGPLIVHMWWVWLVTLALAAAFLVSGITQALSRLRQVTWKA
jgi:hypothetical protein